MPAKRREKTLIGTPAPAGKKAASDKPKTDTCVLCCQKIVETKEDVLFCTGKCNGPIHRYCAGISLPLFESLKTQDNSSNERIPFLCLACTQHAHRDEVCELKSIIATLKSQVKELQEALQSSNHHNPNSNTTSSVAATVMVSRQKPSFGAVGNCVNPSAGKLNGGRGTRGQPRWNSQNSHQLTNRKKPDHREVVSGVRRVWGTLRSASHFVVKNTIAKLANIGNPESIQVKRKSKSTYTGKMKWWFLIHADEDSVLKPLERKWDSVKLQTGWSLENCTKPIEPVVASSNTPSNSTPLPRSDDREKPTDNVILSNDTNLLLHNETIPSVSDSNSFLVPSPSTQQNQV